MHLGRLRKSSPIQANSVGSAKDRRLIVSLRRVAITMLPKRRFWLSAPLVAALCSFGTLAAETSPSASAASVSPSSTVPSSSNGESGSSVTPNVGTSSTLRIPSSTTITPSSTVPLKTVPDTRVSAPSSLRPHALSAASPSLSSASGPVINDQNCSTNTLSANDDGSTGQVNLPFRLDFYGTNYSSLWVNNNGDVTFTGPLGVFTPFLLSASTPPIIAPFFADVDTRGGGGLVTYGATTYQGHPAFCVDWPDVGYYGYHTDKLNDFQLLLVSRSDRGPGDFDIIFNYDQVQWETGDASGGSNGFGGTSAGVGFSAGDSNPSHFFSLPGSLQPGSFLDSNAATGLIHNFHGNSVLGRYIFPIANGAFSGGTTPQEIRNQTSVRCLDANVGTIGANGTKVQLWDCTGAANQNWSIGSDGTIRNAANGRCLGVAPSVTGRAGISLQTWNCDSSPNQVWRTSASGVIQNQSTGLNLDADLGTINANGTKVQLWSSTGAANQSWYTAPAGSLPHTSSFTYCPHIEPIKIPSSDVNFRPCITATDVYDGTAAASRGVQAPANATQSSGCPSFWAVWFSSLSCDVVPNTSKKDGADIVDSVTMSLGWAESPPSEAYFGVAGGTSCSTLSLENDTLILAVHTTANGGRSGSSSDTYVSGVLPSLEC